MPIQRVLGLVIAGALLAGTLPVGADVTVKEILLRKKGENINVRVVVGNPARTLQKGPLAVTLLVRRQEADAWEQIKVWKDISRIKPGEKVARDIFAENSAPLCNVASHTGWQAKAVITGPAGIRAERTVTNTGDLK